VRKGTAVLRLSSGFKLGVQTFTGRRASVRLYKHGPYDGVYPFTELTPDEALEYAALIVSKVAKLLPEQKRLETELRRHRRLKRVA